MKLFIVYVLNKIRTRIFKAHQVAVKIGQLSLTNSGIIQQTNVNCKQKCKLQAHIYIWDLDDTYNKIKIK